MTIPKHLRVKARTLRQRDDALAGIERAKRKIEERRKILERSDARLGKLYAQGEKMEDRLSEIRGKIHETADRRRAQFGRLDAAKDRLHELQELLIELEDCVRRGGL